MDETAHRARLAGEGAGTLTVGSWYERQCSGSRGSVQLFRARSIQVRWPFLLLSAPSTPCAGPRGTPSRNRPWRPAYSPPGPTFVRRDILAQLTVNADEPRGDGVNVAAATYCLVGRNRDGVTSPSGVNITASTALDNSAFVRSFSSSMTATIHWWSIALS